MITHITHVTIWVKNHDDTLKFYRDQLGFKVVTDDATTIPNYRWLTVAPQQQSNLEIDLNLATTPEQLAGVGRQGIFVLASTDVHADFAALKAKGVTIQAGLNVNPWGSDVILEDLCGNDYNVVQPSTAQS